MSPSSPEETMLCRLKFAAAVLITAPLLLSSPPLSAQEYGPRWPACDEYNPAGPMGMAQIALGPADYTDPRGSEIRSFIETGSIGRVVVDVAGSNPRDVISSIFAAPAISRYSPYFGEELRGIEVVVTLWPRARGGRVLLDLRQVCAARFRNTFLYY
jgi:hypothetical protein